MLKFLEFCLQVAVFPLSIHVEVLSAETGRRSCWFGGYFPSSQLASNAASEEFKLELADIFLLSLEFRSL